MTCVLCDTKIQATDTEVVRFLPSNDRPPFNPKVLETDLYTTGAAVERRHESCHILERVSRPQYRGM